MQAVCDFIRAVLVGIFLLLFLTDSLQAWMFLAFTFLMNTVESFRIPAGVGMLPRLVGKEEYKKASSFIRSAGMGAELIGTGLAGLIVALSMGAAFAVDLLTFVLSGLLILGIRLQETAAPKAERKGYFAELKGGFQYLGKNHIFLLLVIGAVLGNSINSIFASLQAPYISEIFRGGSETLSLLGVCETAGLLPAFYFYPKISERISSRNQFLLSFGTSCASYLLLLLIPWLGWFRYPAAGLLMFGWGLLGGTAASLFSVKLVQVVEPDYLGRAAAVFNAAGACVTPLMSAAIAGLVAFLPIQAALLMGAAAAAVVFAVMARLKLCRALNEGEKESAEADNEA